MQFLINYTNIQNYQYFLPTHSDHYYSACLFLCRYIRHLHIQGNGNYCYCACTLTISLHNELLMYIQLSKETAFNIPLVIGGITIELINVVDHL